MNRQDIERDGELIGSIRWDASMALPSPDQGER